MNPEQEAALKTVWPREFGVQFLHARRMPPGPFKALLADIIIDLQPTGTYVSPTPDGRALRVTCWWDYPPMSDDQANAAKANLLTRLTDLTRQHYPDAGPFALAELEAGVEYSGTPVSLTDRVVVTHIED